MSLCTPCTKLKQISLCTDIIIIGTVTGNNIPYRVVFKSLATDRIAMYAVTSSGAGLLTLILPAGFPLAEGTSYEMWVNKVSDSISDQEDLTIGTTTASCFTLSAATIYDLYYDENVLFESQTLEVI